MTSATAVGTGDTLTIGGAFAGPGSVLLDVALDATLAGDSIVVNGATSGVTTISFTDVNPAGEATFTGTGPGNGILVVDGSGGGAIAEGAFTGSISKGAFQYTLNLEDDNIVYLQSEVLSQVFAYSILTEVLREGMPSRSDRLGSDRRTSGVSGTRAITKGGAGVEAGFDGLNLWARVSGTRRINAQSGGFNTGEWEASRGLAEVGIDLPIDLGEGVGSGLGVLGFSAHFLRSTATASSGLADAPTSGIDANGYGAGLTFTWLPGNGFYTDLQGRLTFWDADTTDDSSGASEDLNALGWGASIEAGKRFDIGHNTAITLYGQAAYTDLQFDSFTDANGASIDQGNSASIIVGPHFEIEHAFPENGVKMFAGAGVNYDVLSDSTVDVSGARFESGLGDTWGDVSIGFAAETGSGTSAFVALDLSSALDGDFGDSHTYGLQAGFRLEF